MRKMTVMIAAMLAVLLLISGCTQKLPVDTQPSGVHQPVDSQPSSVQQPQFEWDRDAKEHWRNGDDGEKQDIAAHTMEDDVCTVCGSGIVDFGDSVYVYNYNEHDDQTRNSSYENGVLTYDWVYEYEYDEAGNYVTVKSYENGFLTQLDEYALKADGENLVCKSTSYYDDFYTVCEYDEHGNASVDCSYDTDGVLIDENHYEYELDGNGEYYLARSTYTDYLLNTKSVEDYNVQGDVISGVYYYAEELHSAYYYDYQYDDEGRTTYQSVSDGHRLLEETFYGVNVDVDGWYTYMIKYVVYNDDGTKTVTEYDENEEPINETVYDAQGNVIDSSNTKK